MVQGLDSWTSNQGEPKVNRQTLNQLRSLLVVAISALALTFVGCGGTQATPASQETATPQPSAPAGDDAKPEKAKPEHPKEHPSEHPK